MISGKGNVLDGVGNGCGAGGNCQSRCAAFQSSNPLFKYIGSGVHQTGVDIAPFGQTKSACRLGTVLEYIGRGGVDGHCPGIRSRIRLLLSCVYLQCFKLITHNIPSFHLPSRFIC